MKKLLSIIMLVFFSMNAAAYAAQPIEVLRGPIEKGLALLQDPQYHESGKRELQREKIWEIVQQVFDFTEVAARAVAADWKRFSLQERVEFTQVFSELLKNTYIDKVQGAYHNEKVVFVGQDVISEDKGVVKTKVLRQQVEILMDYNMRLRDNEWKVYDVNVEGVSLVKNYRTQFKEILSKENPAQLIQRLKEKNQKQKEERANKD